MLTLVEKILFGLAVVVTLVATYFVVKRLIRIIAGGQGKADWKLALKRLAGVIPKIATFQLLFRFRLLTSLFHALVGCPFCMVILTDASKADGGEIHVRDVAELVVERLKQ